MRSAFIAVAFVFSTFVALAQIPLSFPHLVVFGDNYSDTVNTYNATATTTLGYDSSGNPVTFFDAFPYPTYGYTAGAFTNGSDTITGSSTQYHSVWHAQLHTLLPGVPLAATPLNSGQSTAGNTNYAWGSATTGTGKTNVNYAGHFIVAVHNLDQQVTDYLNAGYTPDASSLYVLFAGLNDLLQDTSANGINTAAANVTTEAKRLIDAGAVNLLIPNVPGISANPSSPIDIAAAAFRTQLAADISALEAQYASQNKTVHITTLDLYTLYANIRLTPATFGFTDVMDPADAIGSNGFAPSNVDQYLTWDGTNPTTAGHHQIALAACTALAGTATALSINNAAPTVAQPATLTASVSTAGTYGPQSSLAPTGTVTFYYLDTSLIPSTLITLGTATLSASGQATITTAKLSPGTYNIYAVYSGDKNFPVGCNSKTVTTSIAVAAQGFDFTFTQPASYLGMEESAAVTIQPVSIGGFSGNVTFTCGALPTFFSCTFTNNQTVQITNNGTTFYSQLLVGTGTVTKGAIEKPMSPFPRNSSCLQGIALASLLMTPLLFLSRRRTALATESGSSRLLLVLLALGILSLSGCGSGKSASAPTSSDPGFGTTHGPGITYAAPGTYTVNITGTSGNLSVTHVYSIYIADTYDIGVTP